MAPPDPLDGVVDWLRKSFQSEAAEGLDVRYQLDLSGPEGGAVWIRIAGGAARVERGEDPEAGVRLRLALGDWLAMLEGRENVDLLYLAGRLEIEGDLSLAAKLRTLFRPA